MKKFIGFIVGIFLGIASLFTPFMGNSFAHQVATAHAEELTARSTEDDLPQIFNLITIEQESFKFGKNDLIKRDVTFRGTLQQDVYCLYVNSAITFNNIKALSLMITSQKESQSTGVSTGQITKGNPHTISIDDETKECIQKIELSVMKESNTTAMKLVFYLIQTPIDFSPSSTYQWRDGTNSTIIAPTSTFTSLSLTINNDLGSENSPIFIDFYFNGEFYSLYKKGNTIYNQLTDNPIENNEILFNRPGEYEVFIYDLTCARAIKIKNLSIPGSSSTKNVASFSKTMKNYPGSANCDSFEFTIKNNDLEGENIYIVATDRNNNPIINTQIVNSYVNVQFKNLKASYVGKIEVEKAHTYINGDTTVTTEILYPDEYIDLTTINTIKFSEDNSYTINIFNKNATKVIYSYQFTILTEIHSFYGNISSTDQEPNTTREVQQEKIITSSYSGIKEIVNDQAIDLQSTTNNNYTVKIARADCSIEGISEGDTTQDTVTLTLHGVGTIKTQIYRDGNLIETKYLSNNRTLTLSDPGKYKIVTTDELNTTIYKTFTISQEISASTIILICIGVIGLLIFIILVTRARTKIKVR